MFAFYEEKIKSIQSNIIDEDEKSIALLELCKDIGKSEAAGLLSAENAEKLTSLALSDWVNN